ncbi:hypothetical protein HDV00_001337 [Rhizophlyctis rosea]|nr:hypothetical protein HDV00_001337 [Rhizophlyctis rosea]
MSEKDQLLFQLSPLASAVTLQQSGIPVQDTIPYFPDSDLGEDDGPTTYTVREFAVYALVKWLAAAVVAPLEVANIVKQVQYLPSDWYLGGQATTETGNDHADGDTHQEHRAEDFDSDFEDVDPYHFTHDEPSHKNDLSSKPSTTADASGYLVRTEYDDDATRPPYQLPDLDGSTWTTMGEIWRLEGFTALWKGQTAGWLHDVSENMIHPTIEGTLIDTGLDPEHLSTYVASQTLVGFFLSPLDLVRTRLIVQTIHPYHKKYHGTYHALRTIIDEEGFTSLYFGRHFVPTVLYYAVESFFKVASSAIIEGVFGVSGEHQPVAYLLCELALNAVELGVTLPLETVRRRLQCQIITKTPDEKNFETCVERSPMPYRGMWDCVWRMCTEEGGRRSRRGRRGKGKAGKGKTGWWDSWGLRSLYKGFGMRLTAQAVVVVLNAVVNGLEIIEEDE